MSSMIRGECEDDLDDEHDESSSSAEEASPSYSGPRPAPMDHVDVVAAIDDDGGDANDATTSSPDEVVPATTEMVEKYRPSPPPSTSSAAGAPAPAPAPSNSRSSRQRPRPGRTPPSFERAMHVGYLRGSVVGKLPSPYSKLDTNRLTMLHFSVIGLDIVGALDDGPDPSSSVENPAAAAIGDDYRAHIVDWIYSLQHTSSRPDGIGGFKGGTYLGPAFHTGHRGGDHNVDEDDDEDGRRPQLAGVRHHDHVHVAMTYSALCTLATLGDDMSRIDKFGIINSLRVLQRPDGCFRCVAPIHAVGGEDREAPVKPPVGVKEDGEYDMRFLYCAAAISHILSDFSGIDVESAVSYIRSCRSFDGAIGLLPGQEGHGGSTFCGVASLVLMGRLDDVLDEDGWRDELIGWCVRRQTMPPPPTNDVDGGDGDYSVGDNHGGMQGRPNKADDACYSYWIGGTLRLLGRRDDLLDAARLNEFVLRCQHPMFGGFGKAIGVMPDLLHTFYSLAWLSLSSLSSRRSPRYDATTENERRGDDDGGFPPLNELDCALGMCASRTKAFSVFR